MEILMFTLFTILILNLDGTAFTAGGIMNDRAGCEALAKWVQGTQHEFTARCVEWTGERVAFGH
jgi:hypothetical protein